MTLWLGLVVVGQILFAISALVDKYIITSETVVLRPFTYTFWISILSAGSVLVFFFSWLHIPIDGIAIPSFVNVQPLSLEVFALAITAGFAFFMALLSMFTALKNADASDVVPVVGGLNALFTFILGYFFLGTKLPHNFFIGFILLVLGTVLLSRMRLSWHTFLSVAHAGLMFGVHYVAIKALFIETHFDNAFFWSRAAIVVVALSMLLVPYYYDKVITRTRSARARDGALLIGNKILAGLASIILLKAIEFGDVAMVQALGGLQYLVLLGFSACCGRQVTKLMQQSEQRTVWGKTRHVARRAHHFFVRDIQEQVTTRDMVQKLISIPLIVLGFFLLFIEL